MEEREIPSSISKDLIHRTSEATDANALYYDSVLDLETTACFFEHQETQFGPK